MPRGVPKHKEVSLTAPVLPVVPETSTISSTPAPLIIIQPGVDGTYFDCYGLNASQAIDELRLVLLDLVALQADVPIIRSVVRRETRIVAPTVGLGTAKAKTKPAVRRNGRSGDVDSLVWEDELDEELAI